jgi:hypothetical protein
MLIGIDPDSRKSGVAFYCNGKIIKLFTIEFFDLCRCLRAANDNDLKMVYLEAGWLNKNNMHKTPPQASKAMCAKIGMNIGMNFQTGKLLAEYMDRNEIPYTLVRPTSSKVDAKLFKKITGWDGGRTNPEKRDAAMLVWGR